MKGQRIVPHDDEGVVYIKLVMIKPDTIENGDPVSLVDEAPGVILCGKLPEIKAQIKKWFDESAKGYKKEN
jgi:hypothetical protein